MPRNVSFRSSLAQNFYLIASVVMLLLVCWGFKDFYFHGRSYPGRPLTPPIRSLLILHGVSMLGWMLVMVAQPLLIHRRQYAAHRRLGRVAALCAIGLVVLGIKVGIESTRLTPPEVQPFGFTPSQFMAVPIGTILMFAAFVAVGIYKRRQPEVHRAMMFMATLSALTAAIGRIDPITRLYAGTIFDDWFSLFFSTQVIAALLIGFRLTVVRKMETSLLYGFGVTVLAQLIIVHGCTTSIWDGIAQWLYRL